MKVRDTALVLMLTFAGASTAMAAAITINTNAGTTYTATSINDSSAPSSLMDGMEITARWTVDGTAHSQTRFWNSGVDFTGDKFGLKVEGNSENWKLDFDISGVGLLQSLEFNGIPGNTVLDRGRNFAGFDSYRECKKGNCTPGQITATYFDQVILGADGASGDLFAGLVVEFNSFGGLGEGNNWRFSLDTDIANLQLVTQDAQVEQVPEPVSLVLLGTGLFGFAAARRRAARRS